MQRYLARRFFVVKGTTKYSHAKVGINFAKPQHLENTLEDGTVVPFIKTEDPLEGQIVVLAFCKLRTLQFYVQSNKLNTTINRIDIDIKSEFDLNIFYGRSQDPARYKFLDVVLNVEINKDAKLPVGEEEFKKTIETVAHKCPVNQMLSHAGIPKTVKVNLI